MRFSRRKFSLAAMASPLLGSASSQAQRATPTSTDFETASKRLTGLLQYLPGGILDNELHLVWNDFERPVATIRDHAGEFASDYSDTEIAMLAIHANGPILYQYAQMLEEFTGYTFDKLLQTMQFGSLPNAGMLAKLGVPAESLVPFWESLDYEARENEYGTFWTIGEEAEFDFNHPVQQTMLSNLNNIAIIEDDLIAYTQTSDVLAQIMSTATGDAPNRIAELEPTLAGLPEDANSAWLMDGGIFEFGGLIVQQALSEEVVLKVEDMIAESNDAVGQMPVIRTFCVGTTAGASRDEELHNPDSKEFIILETDSADMAEQAAAVIEWRHENLPSLQTGEPHSDLLPGLEIETLDGEFLRVSLPMESRGAMFSRMIQSRDTLLFAYQ